MFQRILSSQDFHRMAFTASVSSQKNLYPI
jgi:hypothetical protein